MISEFFKKYIFYLILLFYLIYNMYNLSFTYFSVKIPLNYYNLFFYIFF
jgi:hypothetical protein